MTLEQVQEILTGNGYMVDEIKAIGYGQQIKFTNGASVNVYDSGKVVVGGKDQERVKTLLGLNPGGKPVTATQSGIVRGNNKVFVVYGHDEQARTQLEAMLRRWGMEPLILDQLPSEGQTIIEKLEAYTAEVQFAVVLATPDDKGHRAKHPDESAYRARQNVVLELGMLLSKLGRKRVAIVLKQQENMERPSDIQGLIYIPFKEDLAKEAGLILAKEMCAQGYNIDVARI
ncbi:TIR domain-containing protein [Geoalkalibacter sp.]|uniref:TIR domain-containing protein n=1 Tax=Geoalkalibacter sp. TaxID=3041440 RepID=UPI00272E129E|nr:TIR domain-containing protein [Geoalkalibacter sp.]